MARLALVAVFAASMGAGRAQAAPRALDLTDPAWQLEGDARVETVDGRAALVLKSGFAYRRDVEVGDGTIELDMRVTGDRSFAYVLFRMQTDQDYEELYFRPHKSRLPDAIQYGPVYQGLTNWKLYHGPGATAFAAFPPNAWIHVRLVLAGERAAVFVGDVREPQMVVPRLARGVRAGHLALRGFLPPGEKVTAPPLAFANVVVRSEAGYDFAGVKSPEPPVPGIVSQWRLSPAFATGDGPIRSMPAGLPPRDAWRPAVIEPDGLVVFGRQATRPPRTRDFAVAAGLTLRAARAGVRRLDLGFSDAVSVFLNGQILYSGDFRYSQNFPRQDGLITLDQASLYLPLRQGDNDLLLVVRQIFGGWGVIGRIEDREGLEIR
jgi:hypothetical protein